MVNADPRNAGLPLAGRITALVTGGFAILSGLLLVLVGIPLAGAGYSQHSWSEALIGVVSIASALWLLPLGWRLALRRARPEGGLLSPIALVVLGGCFLVLPLVPFFFHAPNATALPWERAGKAIVAFGAGFALIRLGLTRRQFARSAREQGATGP